MNPITIFIFLWQLFVAPTMTNPAVIANDYQYLQSFAEKININTHDELVRYTIKTWTQHQSVIIYTTKLSSDEISQSISQSADASRIEKYDNLEGVASEYVASRGIPINNSQTNHMSYFSSTASNPPAASHVLVGVYNFKYGGKDMRIQTVKILDGDGYWMLGDRKITDTILIFSQSRAAGDPEVMGQPK